MDFSSLLERIADLRAEILAVVEAEGPGATQAPAAGGWSPAEVVEHLVRAEDFAILGLWRAVEAVRDRGVPMDGESPGRPPASDGTAETWHDRRTIDEVFADLPDRVDAPEAVIPIRGGRPAGYWAGRLRSHQSAIETLARAIDAAGPDRVVLPHFVAGPLNGRQRLQFFRWHLERHLGQLRRTVFDS